MAREKPRNASHFLTTTTTRLHSTPSYAEDDDEFDEYDIVWSDSNTVPATVPCTSSPHGYTAGISAALLADSQPCSPTSIQRKTTSSPVSMISASSSYLANYNNSSSSCGFGFGSSRFHMSAPVNVPVWPNSRPKFRMMIDEGDDADDLQDEERMVPPHEIVARSRSTTAFSVIEGAGRTLKGRDLTKVRNAVFQKTGFLD